MKRKKIKRENIGGIALNNGIAIKSEKKDVTTKISDDGKITVNIERYINSENKFSILELPFIRGIYNISSQLLSSKDELKDSMRSICNALNIKYSDKDLNINIPFLIFVILIILSLLIVVIPLLISIPFKCSVIIQALIQIVIFSVLFIVIRSSKALFSLLEYHGAEHKIINAYETLDIEDITIENVKKSSRIHRRCGTNCISFFILITILETLFLPINSIVIKMIVLASLIIFNISLAYELVAVLGILPRSISYIFYPLMAVQYITTKKPSDDKLKLAIYGIKAILNDDLDMSVREYIKQYKDDNKDIISKHDYTLQDMLKIVAYVTEKNTNSIYIAINEYMLNYNEQIEITRLLDMLFKQDIPLQYITKRAYFYNEEYIVNENVLIPREDTEILVQKAIEYINRYDMRDMIDLCTGSGCIGISVANNSDIESVILSDISKEALQVARKNIYLNSSENKVLIRQSDLLEEYINNNTLVDIIVSNPPYIKSDVINTLDKKVQMEPHLALDGGITGLDIYIKILDQSKYVLKDNGYLMFEIGYDQLEELKELINSHKEYEFVEAIKDFGGNDRVVICKMLKL